MAKLKQGLLSLASRGSLSGSLTFQRSKGQDIVRSKPTPSDPYSLPQAYQRWLYQDYIARWNTLTPTQKSQYRADASRLHMTPLAVYLREQLTDLPDIKGYWKLDVASGAITPDSSRNNNNLTIFGAIPSTLRIDGSYFFDGVDDRLVSLAPPSLNITVNLTVMGFLQPYKDGADYPAYAVFIDKGSQYMIWLRSGQIEGMIYSAGSTVPRCPSGVVVVKDTIYHVAFTFDQSDLRIYIDGDLKNTVNHPAGIDAQPGTAFWLGAQGPAGSRWCHCELDQVIVLDRCLAQPDILRHSLRRYP